MINEMIRESAYPAMGCMALVSCIQAYPDTARHGRKSRNALVPPHLSPITYQL
jgi:hypothetical protein